MYKNNLFIVASPFQLICAQEAREELCKGAHNHLVIIDRVRRGEPDYDQKGKELDNSWDIVSRHSEPRKRGPRRIPVRIWNTLRILRIHGFFRCRVFLATPHVKWFNLLVRIYGTETILIDDGAASVVLLPKLEAAGKLERESGSGYTFFTMFAGDPIVRRSNGAVIQNRLKYLSRKRKFPQTFDRDHALFMGQWLSERKVIDEASEVTRLKLLVAEHPQYRFSYAPHRYESENKLRKISNFMEIVRHGKSIETVFLEDDSLPIAVYSWYSTALFTLNHLFPELSLSAVKVPGIIADRKQSDELESVYKGLENVGIQVIE